MDRDEQNKACDKKGHLGTDCGYLSCRPVFQPSNGSTTSVSQSRENSERLGRVCANRPGGASDGPPSITIIASRVSYARAGPGGIGPVGG